MSTSDKTSSSTHPIGSGQDNGGATHDHKLKAGAVGLSGVLFMAVANAAPITAMTGNVPIAVGYGNGLGAPAGYFVATIVLTLFTVGFVAMARHITTAGAFYGFITHGLGQVWGMASGALATMAYIVFEGSLIGIVAYFSNFGLERWFGWDANWLVLALIGIVIVAVFGYFDINIAAAFLGVTLIAEIALLGLMAFAVLFSGGGPDGLLPEAVNPLNAFTALPEGGGVGLQDIAAGSAAIGLFFAFWSWVGFESTAMYGEESREPKKIIPRATMLSVVCIGLFYVLVSWSAIVGTGPSQAIALAQDGNTAGQIFFGPVEEHLGSWAVVLFEFLLMTGSYACGMAFHNCASRYIYAIGREDLIPGFGKTLGASHEKHGSPYIAGFVQTGIASVIVLWFFLTDRDPYGQLYALMAIMGTTAIMIVQALAAFACISYFHVHKNHPETAHWFRTFLAPLVGGIGMLYVIWLLVENASFAAGTAASDVVFKASPWIVAAVGIGGLAFALYAKKFSPSRYATIGRVVLEDTEERV